MSLRLVAGLITAVSLVLACGDKFLVATRGTRYQIAPAARKPAAILIYRNPASELPTALETIPVEAVLRNAGYRPTMVASAAEFENALKQSGWDLILVGLSDAQAVSHRVKNTASVLPVVLSSSAASIKQNKQQFPVVLKAPAKTRTLLEAIELALASRPKVPSKTAGSTV